MDKFIIQLLLKYSKIILPDFGAIVISNEVTGELAFKEEINDDDGKLAELIVEESNMDIQEAKNTVAKFVRELKYQLDKGETYSIFRLGEFVKNEDEEYQFIGNIDKLRKKNEKVEPQKTDAPSLGTILHQFDKKEETKPAEKEVSEVPKKENIYIEKEKTEVKQESDPPVIPEQKESDKKPETEQLPEEKKKKTILWMLPLAILLLLGSIWFFKSETIKGFFTKDEITNENDGTSIEEIAEEIADISSTEVENLEDDNGEEMLMANLEEEEEEIENIEEIEDEITPPIVEDQSKKFHIICGTFGEKSNAENKVNQLTNQGISAIIIGPFNQMYYVSAERYTTKEEAQQNLPRLKEKGISGWIYKSKE